MDIFGPSKCNKGPAFCSTHRWKLAKSFKCKINCNDSNYKMLWHKSKIFRKDGKGKKSLKVVVDSQTDLTVFGLKGKKQTPRETKAHRANLGFRVTVLSNKLHGRY